MWELGAKSLELQIRVGRDPMEPGPKKRAAAQTAMGILTGKDTLKYQGSKRTSCYKGSATSGSKLQRDGKNPD